MAVGFTPVDSNDRFGPATLWCWVSNDGLGLALYYVPLLVIWIFAIVSLTTVQRAVKRRSEAVLREYRHRHTSMASDAPASSTHAHPEGSSAMVLQQVGRATMVAQQVRRQLCGFVVVFVVFSTFGLFNRTFCFAAAGACDSPDWLAILLLQGCTMPLQGFANVAIFSAGLRQHWRLKQRITQVFARERPRLPPELS
eukprot:698404-Prymnesium_polylepis.1